MRIKYLTEEAIDNLKETLVDTHGTHLLDDSPDYFADTFYKHGWLKESKYEFPDIEFDKNLDFDISDSINMRNLYESMRGLPAAVAADERVWAGLAFTDMWKFVQFRRGEQLEKGNEFDKLSSFFFMRGGRRGCFLHCISRMWWIAYFLYDPGRDDPYELCTYFASRAFPSRAMLFSSVNLVSNREIAKGIVQCHLDRAKEGKNDGRYPFTEANKYLNCMGGITILDSMSRDEVYQIVNEFLEEKYPD